MLGARRKGIVIAGGGLAGSLAALAMARHRPDVPLLIVEETENFGGIGFRSVFERPLGDDGLMLIQPLLDHHWPGYFTAFPTGSRKFRSSLGGFEPEAVHREMVATLKPDQYRLGTKVVAVREDALVLDGGETVKAEGAIDARGAVNLSMLDLLFETAIERRIRLDAPHGLDRPVLIDSTVEDQSAGLSFVRCFPLGEEKLLIARATVSDRSQPSDSAAAQLDHYLQLRGWKPAATEGESVVVRPLPIGGDFDAFWRIGGARVAKLGVRGGFIHPATGAGVADSVRNALLLAAQADFSGSALHRLFEQEARQLWKKRQPLREYNAALKSTPPADRLALVRRLYQAEPALIARFHAADFGLIDRVRLRRAYAPG
ncbi:MAG TPA: lycopene beta-cyclase CrtY [Allosphingosinicella sp.]|nr:lycopene beta-cyclase CrtY [Allosphingosinicella sp.]